MDKLILLVCILTTFIRGYTQNKKEILEIKIRNEQEQPVFGVYVSYPQKAILLTSSDMDGECKINISPFQMTDTIQFQGIGFNSLKITIQALIKHPQIYLKELNFNLSEAQIEGLSTEQLLKSASAKLKKIKGPRKPLCQFISPALYEKITSCQDTIVEYRQEYGLYFTSGNVLPYNSWDKTYRSYMVPKYMARSFNLTTNGQDTLVPVFLTTDNIRFDIGTRKIFTFLRAIQLYGPLFEDLKYYEIHAIESDNSDYLFSFKTRTEAYPDNIRISCKGTFSIDKNTKTLKTMEFDYIDYQLLRQVLLSKQRKTASPFSTKATLTFATDSSNRPYIRSCHQITTWKYDLGEDFILIEQPSRDLPGFHQLVEEEAFYCGSPQNIPSDLQNDKILTFIHLAYRYPIGSYHPELFQQFPQKLDINKARQDLGRYMKLEDQFSINSDKPYYPENYLSGRKVYSQEKINYLTNLRNTRKRLFEIFDRIIDLNTLGPLSK